MYGVLLVMMQGGGSCRLSCNTKSAHVELFVVSPANYDSFSWTIRQHGDSNAIIPAAIPLVKYLGGTAPMKWESIHKYLLKPVASWHR